MPKQFFTERDIEDMAARGQHSLTISEDMVLTELAFEMAERLGVKLVQPHQTPPAAPVRPYLSEEHKPAPKAPNTPSPVTPSGSADLRQRIRTAVRAKLGDQVDDALLEAIITRVLNNVGVR